jgi:hypothetical protein
MATEEQREDWRRRIAAEIDRQPHFDDQYPHLSTISSAVESILELVEEESWAQDNHDWCHNRPDRLALLGLWSALVGLTEAMRDYEANDPALKGIVGAWKMVQVTLQHLVEDDRPVVMDLP